MIEKGKTIVYIGTGWCIPGNKKGKELKKDFRYICIEKTKGSYSIEAEETNWYLFALFNDDDHDGYVHYTIQNEPPLDLFIPFLIFSGIFISVIVIISICALISKMSKSKKIRKDTRGITLSPYSVTIPKMTCKKCGAEVLTGDYCSNCGAKFDSSS